MGGHAALVGGIEVDEAIDLVVVGGGGDVMTVLAVVEIGLLAETEAFVREEVLVLRVMRMLGRS